MLLKRWLFAAGLPADRWREFADVAGVSLTQFAAALEHQKNQTRHYVDIQQGLAQKWAAAYPDAVDELLSDPKYFNIIEQLLDSNTDPAMVEATAPHFAGSVLTLLLTPRRQALQVSIQTLADKIVESFSLMDEDTRLAIGNSVEVAETMLDLFEAAFNRTHHSQNNNSWDFRP